jgi:hypothetical protein
MCAVFVARPPARLEMAINQPAIAVESLVPNADRKSAKPLAVLGVQAGKGCGAAASLFEHALSVSSESKVY